MNLRRIVKTILLILWIIVPTVMTSCQPVPDNLKSSESKPSIVNNSQAGKVSYDHIYDDMGTALETEYSKLKLPDRSQIPIIKPDGIYELELGYLNSDGNTEWMKEKVEKIYEELGFSFSGETVIDEGTAYKKDMKNDISIMRYSQPYCRWAEFEKGVSMLAESIISIDTLYCDRSSDKETSSEIKKVVSKAEQLSNDIGRVMGDELENTVSDIYTIHTPESIGYEAEIRKTYKGIGIQDLISKKDNSSEFEEADQLLAVSMQTYLDFDSEIQPEYYVGCNSYSVKNDKRLDDVLSFKAACDILEQKLAENVMFEFDTVLLMYEPRGKTLSNELIDPGVIKCKPKWYFISDNSFESGLHSIYYVTVDCEDGIVEVVMP